MSAVKAEQWFYLPSDWSVLTAAGSEASTFLNGFCTNDVVRLNKGETCEAFFTDVKARILAYAWIVWRREDYAIVLSSLGAGALHDHLDKYLLSAQVELNVDQNTRVIILGEEPTGLKDFTCFPLNSYGPYIKVAVDDASAIARHAEELSTSGWSELSEQDFEHARIQLGVPKDRIDVDERNLPQEVDRDAEAISFEKGCYLGQEPVARIDALGRVNWLLRGLRFSSQEVQPGDELLREGKCVGRVTSVAAVDEGAIALGYVRRECAASDEQLQHAASEVIVCDTPFIS